MVKQVIQIILALLFLLAVFSLIILGSLGVWKVGVTLSPQITAAIIAGVATVLVSVFSILWSKRSERLREIEQEQRKQKLPIYEEFVAFVLKLILAEKLGNKPVPEKEMIKFMSTFAQKLIVWGADEVLSEYVAFRHMAATGSGLQIAFAVEKLLLAIRKDIGHKNAKLQSGDILRVFINDIDTALLDEEQQKSIPKKTNE